MEEQIQRLIGWSNGIKQGPFSIEIHPTNLCNLNCIMCGTQIEHKRLMKENPSFHPSKYIPFELTKEEMIKIVHEGYFLGVKKWLITGGGEPLVRKQDTFAVMKEIKKYSMYGNINTNGVLLNQDDIEQIIKIKWDMIMFSVDSHIQEVHDFLRGMPGTFYNIKQVLDTFKSLKKRGKTELPKIVFNTVLCNKNIKELDSFIKFGYEVGCTDITFIPLIQFSHELKELALSSDDEEQFQREIPKLVKIAEKYNIHTNLQSLIKEQYNRQKSKQKKEQSIKEFSCFEPFLNLVIRMDGKYSPCCMIENYNDSLTNKSLQEIWFGSYFSELRENMLQNKIPEGCSHCVYMQMMQNIILREELRKRVS